MKKVLIFHPYLAPYRVDLYNSLAKHCLLNVLLTGSVTEKKSLGFNLDEVNKLAQFNYSYHNNGFYIGRHLLSFIYYKTIKLFNPDVVIAHELGINTLFAILLKPFFHYKLFVTVDDSPAMAKNYTKNRNRLRNFVVRHVELMMVINPTVKEILQQKYSSDNCQFIYFPIIQDEENLQRKIKATNAEVEKLTQKHNLSNKKIILFVGRLEEIKCPDKLVKTFHEINDPNSLLVLIGSGSLKDNINTYIQKHHLELHIIMTGKLTGAELYAWYRLAHIFVLPSKFEPFGAVVNEALIAGCWVLTSDKVGSKCLINNTNGIIFESDNKRSLFQNLNYMLGSIKQHSNQNIRQNKMNISFNELLKQIINLINTP